MCKNCRNICGGCNNSCDKACFRHSCCCNRYDEFIWPMMFWLIRDMTRQCRCNFIDRYESFRY